MGCAGLGAGCLGAGCLGAARVGAGLGVGWTGRVGALSLGSPGSGSACELSIVSSAGRVVFGAAAAMGAAASGAGAGAGSALAGAVGVDAVDAPGWSDEFCLDPQTPQNLAPSGS